MVLQIIIAIALIVVTSTIHASGMLIGLRFLILINSRKRMVDASVLVRLFTLVSFILILFIAILFETGMWALTFTYLGAIPDFFDSFYFSAVTYTTLGYGDIVLDENWRILSSFAAANGVIMLGWTVALVIIAINYFSKSLLDFRKSYEI